MDKYPDIVQLLTIAGPNLESVLEPKDAAECARIANDEMAELVAKHPDRFCGACASLPMNDIDAALVETDRAIKELRFRGVEIFTDHNGRPVDAPEIFPLYEKMAAYNLPILLHPAPHQHHRRLRGRADVEIPDLHELRMARTKRRSRWRGWRSAARWRSSRR